MREMTKVWSTLPVAFNGRDEAALLDRAGKVDSADACRNLVRAGRFTESFMMGTNGGATYETLLRPAPPVVAPGATEPARPRRPGGLVLHNVIGNDDRILISDTSQIPARSIGLLQITLKSGGIRWGTAWLIGPRTLATAAHNLLHPDDGPAESWKVGMAYDGRSARGGWHDVIDNRLPDGWTAKPEAGSPYDYAILKIADPAIGNQLGWFGFADYEDAKFQGLVLNLFGYPQNVPQQQRYYLFGTAGRTLKADAGHIFYDCDAGEGMSGGPVIARFGDQRIAVGIHAAGGNAGIGNVGTRINDAAYALFKEHEAW